MATLLGLVAFFVLLLLAIFFHEFGHFVTARWAGVKVSKFFVGFGPTLWSVRRGRPETVRLADGGVVTRPETEYGVKALPLGGFVKIVGMSMTEDVAPEDVPRSFGAAPAPQRAVVLAAGSLSHFVTAFVMLFVIFALVGVPDARRPTLVVDAVQASVQGRPSPASLAGLRPGDRIVAIGGERVTGWTQVRDAIRNHPGRRLIFTVQRGGRLLDLVVTPVPEMSGGGAIGFVGIGPRFAARREGPVEALGDAAATLGGLVREFFSRVPTAFSPRTLGLTGAGGPTPQRPFSIIGAGRIATELAAHGRVADFLLLFVEINIFVGLFNLLPLPPLDGGHLFVLVIEKVRGRPVDQRALLPVMAVVVSVLLLLALLLGYYDVTAPIRIP